MTQYKCECGASQRGPVTKPEIRHNSETGATRKVHYATCRNGHRYMADSKPI